MLVPCSLHIENDNLQVVTQAFNIRQKLFVMETTCLKSCAFHSGVFGADL